jgi:hypothetical protein
LVLGIGRRQYYSYVFRGSKLKMPMSGSASFGGWKISKNRAHLGFLYTDRVGKKSPRRVEPHGLLVETPVWYVLARDVDKGEPRTFRMDRIARPRLLADISFLPDLQLIQAQLPDLVGWRPLMGRWAS